MPTENNSKIKPMKTIINKDKNVNFCLFVKIFNIFLKLLTNLNIFNMI